MGRVAKERATLPDGSVVGYGFVAVNGIFRVQFKAKDGTKYIQVSTGVPVPAKYDPEKDKPPVDVYQWAAKAIVRHYVPDPDAVPIRATWDKATDYIKATPDLRPESVRAYLTAVKAFRSLVTVRGPADVTEEHAVKFKRMFLSGTFTRTTGGTEYKRSPVTCTTYLRSLRSLWKKHFKPAGFVRSNPWLEVPYPNASRGKRVRMPGEENVTAFLAFMDGLGWELPALWARVKMTAVCRTIDLCRVKSADLTGDVLTLTDTSTKTRTTRRVHLPPELAAALHQIKGETWLWERSVAESKVHRPAVRTKHQTDYNPSTWRWTLTNLFREFNKGRGKNDRVRPHDLRARGITLVAAATGSVDQTAELLGVDPQTARHYLDRAKAFAGGDVMKKLAGVLVPPTPPPAT